MKLGSPPLLLESRSHLQISLKSLGMTYPRVAKLLLLQSSTVRLVVLL